jgi:hypothetical protein
MKHLKHTSETVETLAKHQKKLKKHMCIHYKYCNIQMKILTTYVRKTLETLHPDLLLQHPDKTLATYI